LLTTVNNCGEKTNDHTLDVATVLALKNAINLCRNATENAWKEAAEKLSESVASSLSSLRSLLSNKKEADELLEAIDEVKIKMPTSAKGIQSFLDSIERGQKMIDDLHLDDETERFINKVKLQRATIADLTPHVLKWVEANNLTNVLKVRF
jgi:superfamily I DNA/RNA helicase